MRVPFEPVLLLFAGVVLAGTRRRPGRGWIAASLVTCSAAAVLPQIPRSLEGWHWSQDSGRHPSTPAAPEPAAPGRPPGRYLTTRVAVVERTTLP